MTETNASSRPFYVATAPSGIHAGQCLLACGHNRMQVREWCSRSGYVHKFVSQGEAVETYPEWEEEIMTS